MEAASNRARSTQKFAVNPSPSYQNYANHRRLVVFLLCLVVIGATGCMSVKRRVIIRTQPGGAGVSIDGIPVGTTPLAVPHTYGGSRDVLIERDGYETVKERVNLSDPLILQPPLSFVTENFSPTEIRHQPVLDFQLQPKRPVNGEVLLQRANTLRGNVQRGTVTAPAR